MSWESRRDAQKCSRRYMIAVCWILRHGNGWDKYWIFKLNERELADREEAKLRRAPIHGFKVDIMSSYVWSKVKAGSKSWNSNHINTARGAYIHAYTHNLLLREIQTWNTGNFPVWKMGRLKCVWLKKKKGKRFLFCLKRIHTKNVAMFPEQLINAWWNVQTSKLHVATQI